MIAPWQKKLSEDQQRERALRVQELVGAAVACALCPKVTPDKGITIMTRETTIAWPITWPATRVMGKELAEDSVWQNTVVECLNKYWGEHGHGPTWRVFWALPGLWEPAMRLPLRHVATMHLLTTGVLTGALLPFGLAATPRIEPTPTTR